MAGNLGDHRFCRDGVWEFRIDVGSGNSMILLLCGGDKRTQSEDIDTASSYWSDWQKRVDP